MLVTAGAYALHRVCGGGRAYPELKRVENEEVDVGRRLART